jgi:carboxymethylenebutenolidase
MQSAPQELEVRTPDGVARAWLHGGGAGPRPAVLLYVDAFGVRETMQAKAARLAGLGYLVLLPDVFYRAGAYPPFDKATVWTDPPERARLMALLQSITPERLRTDAAAWLDTLAAHGGRPDRVGVVGYCMGGRLAVLTAALHPERVRAAASFHGGGLVTDAPESPHRLADRVKASLYLAVADEDRGCTPAHQGVLAAVLGAAHVHYAIELYPGKRHGFAVPDHPGAHDPEAEARHWRRLEAFLGEGLRWASRWRERSPPIRVA